jgi:hypothetical protein
VFNSNPCDVYLTLQKLELKCRSCEAEICAAAKDGQFQQPLLKLRIDTDFGDQCMLNREIRINKSNVQIKETENDQPIEWNKNCAHCDQYVKVSILSHSLRKDRCFC